MYGLVYKCSTACLKVRRVLCARAPCPALDRRGESAYVTSVPHEYMLFSWRSLFLHPPVCFFCMCFLKIILIFVIFSSQHALISLPFLRYTSLRCCLLFFFVFDSITWSPSAANSSGQWQTYKTDSSISLPVLHLVCEVQK